MVGSDVGLLVGSGVGSRVGRVVGSGVGLFVGSGLLVGSRVGRAVGIGSMQISSSASEQTSGPELQFLAPQHSSLRHACPRQMQGVHDEKSLRSRAPSANSISTDPSSESMDMRRSPLPA